MKSVARGPTDVASHDFWVLKFTSFARFSPPFRASSAAALKPSNAASLLLCWQLGTLNGAVWGVNALLEGNIAGALFTGETLSDIRPSTWTLRLGVPFLMFAQIPILASSFPACPSLAGESFPLMEDVTEFRVDGGHSRGRSPVHRHPPLQTPLTAC